MRIIIILLTALAAVTSAAATIEKREFADSVTVNKKNLVLNGMGLRVKRKLGMNFDVYVAALYVAAKSNDAEKLIQPSDKVLEMIFMRSIDKDTLQEAWSEAFPKNCRSKCEEEKASLKKFNDLMADVKDGSRLKITFDKDGVSVDMQGKKDSKTGRIDGAAFAENLMAIFIGKEPPTEDLKKGLLGAGS